MLFLICSDLLNCLRSLGIMFITTESSQNSLKIISLDNLPQKLPFFPVLMYALYGNLGYFKFKRKYQRYGWCFQTIFPFLLTMEIKLTFCIRINIKVSYKVISTLWASKFSTRWPYHYWWTWSSIFKVLKVTRLQYLYNISKKKLRMEFIFCTQR